MNAYPANLNRESLLVKIAIKSAFPSKAKEVSKELLESARKLRARLQPALVKEFTSGDEINYSKLVKSLLRIYNMLTMLRTVIVFGRHA